MGMGTQSRQHFVFQDRRGRRWMWARLFLLGLALFLTAAAILFVQSLWIRPALRLPEAVRTLKRQLKAETKSAIADARAENWQLYLERSQKVQERLALLHAERRPRDEVRLGYVVDWDANSEASLRTHAWELTHIAPEWFNLRGPDGHLESEVDPALRDFATTHRLKLMPLLRNLTGDVSEPEAVENLARANDGRQTQFAKELLAALSRAQADGVLIDWNELDTALSEDFTRLLGNIATVLHQNRREVWLTISPNGEVDTFDLAALSEVVDRFVATEFDEHSEADEPGPLASQDWFEGWLEVHGGFGRPEQWVIGLGSYACDWNVRKNTVQMISFRDAMSRASYAGVEEMGGVKVDTPDFNGQYAYTESEGEHTVAFLDAVSFANQLRAVRAGGFGGVGVYRLGTEDPAIWDVLQRRDDPDAAFLAQIGKMSADDTVTHVGRGEVVSVSTTRDDGERHVELLPDGQLRATYTDFPTYPVLYHEGASDKHVVAITFDDGPDPVWTSRILDILKAADVKATFFVTGKNAEDHPNLLRRLVGEGHEVGNHTYTHGNMAEMGQWRMRLELDATQRLIESVTGYSTTLFRPPYNADSTPTDVRELIPLDFAERELGYTVVLEKVDPQDWSRPGADVILQRVKDLRHEGNIILLHDAGGNRSQTVEALPKIIAWLRERGDRVVPMSELLGIPHAELMPAVEQNAQAGLRAVASAGFHSWHWLVEVCWAFTIVATGLVVLRSLVIVWLAWRHHRATDTRPLVLPQPVPPVSVLIAAYNEEKVIGETLRSVIASQYPGRMEIIVVDDGSKDGTVSEVTKICAEDERVVIIIQRNGGKSSALRNALENSRHEIVVFLDADTHFEPDTIARLVAEMGDERVAAVSGHAKVGNIRNFVTRCQSLEYLSGFNLDRRAYTVWDCVTVVPGAVSALRRSAIVEAGGFSHDTLAEDTDMTLTLHKLGYRVAYAPAAVAWTEAPETWRALVKQRLRWCFGVMQCVWKHRDIQLNPRFGALGWFSMPGIVFFQFLLVALVPFADAVLLWSIFAGYAAAIQGYFIAFLGMDLFLAAVACKLEGEPLRRAFIVMPMRFVYRWMLAWVVWKSIFRVLRGAFVGWGKLERTANMTARVVPLVALLLLPGLGGCERPQRAVEIPRTALAEGRLQIPADGIYAGAYTGFGETEDDVSLERIEAFESFVGKHQAIIASSSYWGVQTFPDENVRLIARHGSVPLVFWSPWDSPYTEGTGPDRFALATIIAGAQDDYITKWAEAAAACRFPIMVSFANEMNGSWFPWSGCFYGGGKPLPGGGFEGPETFKRAWRHIVDICRAHGATNILWTFHVMDFSMPQEKWNLAAQYYPGSDYVDWLGFSLYGAQFPSDNGWAGFTECFDWPYTELALLDPAKPIMLCEFGVGEFPKKGDKGAWIREAFNTMADRKKYPRLKAAVFWHERWTNSADSGNAGSENAEKVSDLRVNSSPGALRAYRASVASPLFLEHPILAP